ncbi:MAG: N-formylglutamate deformylase, partial [Planctomycetota bacterium]
YPGRTETGLVPTRTFGGAALYAEGDEPGAAERQSRVETWWDPYHDRLQQELARLKQRFGYALLFDAHSITSVVPDFFEGELPGLVLGDANGATADASIIEAVRAVHVAADISTSHNSPFRGGYITRSYGRPSEGVHALQLEMAQRLYMHEGPPFSYAEDRANALQPLLRATLTAFLDSARLLV